MQLTQLRPITLKIIALVERFPWAIALFGFVSGLASFFLVERKQGFAQVIAMLMLASWAWLTLENVVHRGVLRWFGFELPPYVLSYATQLVHQESLFFVIPFFFITTAWNTGQAVFSGLLILAAVVSIVDPIYYRWLSARRWFYFLFHSITLFAVLLTALPVIFHLPTAKTYLYSLVTAVLFAFPSLLQTMPDRWWQRLIAIAASVLVALGVGLWARPWIPPAGLWLTQVAITTSVTQDDPAPKNALRIVSFSQLHQGIYAFTAIHAPRGLNERIFHVWKQQGQVVDKIPLEINGGREAGYRSWSRKENFPEHPAGDWRIEVRTEADQVIGTLRFRVVESLAQLSPAERKAARDRAPAAEDAADVTPYNKIKTAITEVVPDGMPALSESSSDEVSSVQASSAAEGEAASP